MHKNPEETALATQRREQMLRLVAKGFFKELVNYGVETGEIVRVASHLLDNLIGSNGVPAEGRWEYDTSLSIDQVRDDWTQAQAIGMGDVTLRPLELENVPIIHDWLKDPSIRACFVKPFPRPVTGLGSYFRRRTNDYLQICHDGKVVGFIGGENLDRRTGKLEMKKCVGYPELRGKGIGKKATFGFLYYAFRILGMHKVYIYSRDINLRNVNLNSRLGFEVEGVFLEETLVKKERQDIVRMALLRPVWEGLFAGE